MFMAAYFNSPVSERLIKPFSFLHENLNSTHHVTQFSGNVVGVKYPLSFKAVYSS